MATQVTLSNANGDSYTLEIEFDPNHIGLMPALTRAAKKKSGKATAANGAVTIKLVSSRRNV